MDQKKVTQMVEMLNGLTDPVVHALDQLADHARAVRRDDEAVHTEHALHIHAPVASDGVHPWINPALCPTWKPSGGPAPAQTNLLGRPS
jgi:hypothetical protein